MYSQAKQQTYIENDQEHTQGRIANVCTETETWKRIRDTLMAELQTCVLKRKQNVLTQLYIREHYVCLNLYGRQRLAHLTFCWGQPVLDWLQQTTHVRPRMHGRKRYSTNILNTKSTKGLAPRRPRWKWITGTSAHFGVEMPHRRYGKVSNPTKGQTHRVPLTIHPAAENMLFTANEITLPINGTLHYPAKDFLTFLILMRSIAVKNLATVNCLVN